jgi:O-antigen ligase
MLRWLTDPSILAPGATGQTLVTRQLAEWLAIVGLVCAAGCILIAPLPIATIGAAGYVLISARDRIWPLCLVVLSLPFDPIRRPVGSFAFSPTEIFIVLTVLGAILGVAARFASRRSWSDLSPPPASRGRRSEAGGVHSTAPVKWLARLPGDRLVTFAALLVVVAAAASLTASAALHESVQAFRVVIVEPAAFYLVAVTAPDRKRLATFLAYSLVVSGVLISAVGFWQYAFGERIITAEADLRRIRGFYGSPNNLGLFLGRPIPVAMGLSIWWARGRVAFAAAAVTMLAALLLTFSLGAWVAVAAAAFVIAFLRGRRALVLAALVGFGTVLLTALAALWVPRIGSHFDFQSSTSSIRLDVWRSGLDMLADHPVRGIGLDNFLYYYQHGYRLPTAWQDPNLSHPHNVLLDFWLSLGLPGPILLGLLAARFVSMAKTAWGFAGPTERGLIAGACGALAAMLVHGMVDNSFFLPDLAVLFWVMFVIVAGVVDTAKASSTV